MVPLIPIRENRGVSTPKSEEFRLCEGFAIGDKQVHALNHSAVSDQLLSP